MCSSCVLVVQSTIVTASIVRGSAPRPRMTSLLLTRSWAPAGAAAGRAGAGGEGGGPLGEQAEDQRDGESASEATHMDLLVQTLSLGSRRSRSQSPSRLTPSAVSASAAPGKAASHHAT